MGKRWIVVVILVLLTASVAGCGSAPTPDYGTQATDILMDSIYSGAIMAAVLEGFPANVDPEWRDSLMQCPSDLAESIATFSKLVPPESMKQTHSDTMTLLRNLEAAAQEGVDAFKAGDRARLEAACGRADGLLAEVQRVGAILGKQAQTEK